MQAVQQQPKFEKRTIERVSVRLPGGVRKSGCKKVPATLTDLSERGCALAGVINMRVDDTVWVGLPGLEGQQARIRWTSPGSIGLSFADPLHPAVFSRLCSLRTPEYQ